MNKGKTDGANPPLAVLGAEQSMLPALLSYEDLAARWGKDGQLVSTRQVKRICAKIGLKPVDLSHKIKRFRPADVDRAECRAAGHVERNSRFKLDI